MTDHDPALPLEPEATHTASSQPVLRRRDVSQHHSDTEDIALDDLTSNPICRRPARAPKERSALSRFWTRHVHPAVEQTASRDHLALERTYLAYLRTSLAFANFGVTIAQLFRLQGSDTSTSAPSLPSYFQSVGRPLATIFIVAGILVCLKGGWRFYRQQAALVRGKIIASGWELAAITVLSAVVFVALFWVVVGVDINNDVTSSS